MLFAGPGSVGFFCFFFNDTATTEIYTLSLHDALPISNQSAYIVIDRSTGERTVLWRRDDCLKVLPEEITDDMISGARLLHIDGHDTPAVARAAEIARRHGIPVTVDVDTIYQGFDRVLPNVDYLVASSEFPTAWTGETDPFKALETIQKQ